MCNMETNGRITGLSGNQLKLIALIAMTVDHVGMILFPYEAWFRVVGRLAFPIFAYMIGEGCAYTRHRGRYIGKMAGLALACQIVYYLFMDSLYQCVLVTFSLSIGLAFLIDNAGQRNTAGSWILAVLGLAAVYFLTEILPGFLPGTDYGVDYGFFGVLLPLAVYLGRTRQQKFVLFSLGAAVLAAGYGGIQWYSLLALPLMMLYNGRRGRAKLKNLFYIYYPAHLVALQLVAMLI